MIVRNTNDEVVQETTYIAHGGGIARMLLTNRELTSMLFLADASLAPGKTIEAHIDPYEEIYYILDGEGIMMVGEDEKRVKKGDSIWIPMGKKHSLLNDTNENTSFLVVAAYPHSIYGF